MTLMEQFVDPSLFEGLSMGERLAGATVTMCMGLGLTFCILLLLWLAIAIMSRVMKTGNKGKKKEEPAPAVTAAAPVQEAAPAEAQKDDGELIAVIAAAIAASENTPVSNLVVRKIQRISGPSNAWNSAGLGECIESRRM